MWGLNRLKKRIKNSFVKSTFQTLISKTSDELHVFGNGYSIADMDISVFNNADCFVCNKFYCFKGFDEFIKKNNITYFAMDGINTFSNIASVKNIPLKEVLENYIDPWSKNRSYTIVVESTMSGYIKSIAPEAKVAVLSTDVYKLIRKKIEPFVIDQDILKSAVNIGHTPQAMILAGMILGYKKIYLYGVDHTYVRDILNKSPMAGKHFYLETQKDVLNSNFVFGRGQYDFKLSKLLFDNAKIFKTFESQKSIAAMLNIDIQDKTGGSLFMFQDFDIFDLALLEST